MKLQGLLIENNTKLKCGGEFSKPENRFTLDVIETPVYTLTKLKRESIGNGWYGGKEEVEYTIKYLLAIKDNIVLGYLRDNSGYKDPNRKDVIPLSSKEKSLLKEYINNCSLKINNI